VKQSKKAKGFVRPLNAEEWTANMPSHVIDGGFVQSKVQDMVRGQEDEEEEDKENEEEAEASDSDDEDSDDSSDEEN